jgi:tryptophanyl-tRNA synthetase
MSRTITGFQPTGHLTVGNYFGAIRPILDGDYLSPPAGAHDNPLVFIADLHAMTVEHDPAGLRALTREFVALLLAAGLDPNRATLFVQSQVPEHTGLHYLLECATGYGEAHRMIQFKEKSAGKEHVRLSLLSYPVLMAADILLYDIDEVPVGEDQSQHLELTRDVATRFNARYGETFVIPKAVQPSVAARVRDLSDPLSKMSKTNPKGAGVLYLLDPPDVLRRKVMRAVTDTGREVRYDPEASPGVANLLELLGACVDASPTALAGQFDSYGELKTAVADAVVTLVEPVRARFLEFSHKP